MTPPLSDSLYCDDADALEAALSANVARCDLFRGISRLGLAVSGGADSVALLHLLPPLCRVHGIALAVLHADHGLRAESAQEAAFVKALAEANGLPCLTRALNLPGRAPSGDSPEMAARAERHAFFAECCRDASLDAVATGHQADDLAETLLLRLARGAGSGGLSALRPRAPAAPRLAALAGRPYLLVRPLLPFSGRALRAWLKQRGLSWCEDVSNRSCAIPRNRLRHVALPQFEAAWQAPIRPALCRSADILREEDAFLDELAAERLRGAQAGDGALDLRALAAAPLALQRRAVRLWLFDRGLPHASGYEAVRRILDAGRSPATVRIQLSAAPPLTLANGVLSLDASAPLPLAEAELEPGARIAWGDLEIRAELARGPYADSHGVGSYPAVCSLSEARVAGRPLRVRARQPGDRIAPTGMAGTKKLQDLFVDAKLPEDARGTIPVLTCGGDVVWVPGYRIARAYAVPGPEAPCVRITVRRRPADAPRPG